MGLETNQAPLMLSYLIFSSGIENAYSLARYASSLVLFFPLDL